MKIGYSILLGEYIDAQAINYTDCKSFQIVCPICREPIFKVERKDPPPILHYLSHYEKSKAFVSDCELRVKGISDNEKKAENNLARGQKLEYFLSVLKDCFGIVNPKHLLVDDTITFKITVIKNENY
mgnify:CR=1 FL=1